jgi:hypothetical protein
MLFLPQTKIAFLQGEVTPATKYPSADRDILCLIGTFRRSEMKMRMCSLKITSKTMLFIVGCMQLENEAET